MLKIWSFKKRLFLTYSSEKMVLEVELDVLGTLLHYFKNLPFVEYWLVSGR